MKAETDPITPDEFFIRRIHKSKLRAGKSPYVSPNAFEPRLPEPNVKDPDTDGISLYREACLQSPEEVLANVSEEKRRAIGLVRVSGSLVLGELKLEVISSQTDIRGHVVIRDIRCETYTDKSGGQERCKRLMLRLAEEASREENMVRIPPDLTPPQT